MTYKDQIKGLSDMELLNRLYEGEESFREGVYEFMLNEAKGRGLEIFNTQFEEKIKRYKQKSTIDEEKNLIRNGWILTFIVFGLGGLIIGLQLLLTKEKTKDGIIQKKYSKKARSNGLTMAIIGGIPITLILISIIYTIIIP